MGGRSVNPFNATRQLERMAPGIPGGPFNRNGRRTQALRRSDFSDFSYRDDWPEQIMDLSGHGAREVISAIRKIDVDHVVLNEIGWYNRNTISSLYAEGELNDLDIEKAFEDATLNCAVRDYNHILEMNRDEAHHIGRPAVLAYGLEMGLFSPDEIAKIPFDIGQDMGGFIERYGVKNLPRDLVKEFLNPTEPHYIDLLNPCGT